MFNKTIKAKLINLVIISLITISVIITVIAVYSSEKSLLDAKFNQLKSIQSSKQSEILNYFDSLKSLLVSLAQNEGTKEAFLAFQKGFYNLEKEIALEKSYITSKLKSDFTNNYLNSVNYDIPNSSQRKNIQEYLPSDTNALIAQYIFITDNQEKLGEKNAMLYNSKYESTYMDAHKKYHQSFDTILNAYSLYDIFMVDLKGNLIYTDFKEKDYATNLKYGIYKDTGIADVYKKALKIQKGELAFDDFRPYEPSYNSAASFISTPIFKDNKKIGVLIFQMPVDKINNIMQYNGKFKEAGLGESGETYLVGEDYKMRSNSRFQKDISDQTVQKLGSTIGVWEIKTASVIESLKNNSGQWIIPDYRDINVLSAYSSLNIFDQAKWSIIAEIDEDEALNAATELKITIILVSIITSLIILLITILLVNRIVLKPINNFTIYFQEFLNFISFKQNTIEKNIPKHNNEFSVMITHINNSIDMFDDRFKQDMKVIGEIILTLDKLQKGVFRCRVKSKTKNPMVITLKNTINSMLESLEETMKNIENITKNYTDDDYRSKINISRNIEGRLLAVMNGINSLGEALSSSAKNNLNNGQYLEENASIMKSSMNNLASKANEQAASLEETSASIEEITALTRNNTQNAFKMGEFGENVKQAVNTGQKLAIETASSMEEINEKVSSINEAITVIDQIAFQTNILSLNAAVEAATAGEAGKGFAVVAQEVRNLAARSAEAAKEIKELVEDANSKANEGKLISDEMISGYQDLNTQINENIHLIEDVTNSSKEQMTGIEQINDAITMLDRVTQENASEANQITSIASDVATMAQDLVLDAKNKKFN